MEDNNQNQTKEAPEGEEGLLSWTVPEYQKHEKTTTWYIIAGTIGAVLLLFALFTTNFLFALLIVIAAAVVVIIEGEEPRQITITLTEEGIIVGKNFYDYDEFAHFAIVYKPQQDIKQLYFEFNSSLKQRISIPLKNINPVKVREILTSYMEEDTDRTDPPLSEQLSRLLKL